MEALVEAEQEQTSDLPQAWVVVVVAQVERVESF
jgi:hypothetical protein